MCRVILFAIVLILSCASKERTNNQFEFVGDKEVVCFIYHRFGDRRYPTTNTPTKDFEAHLAYLKKNNYTILSFSAAITYLQSDVPTQKIAVLTIDDGYKSFFKNAFPLLKKYKMPATLFINTKTVGGGDYMTWADLKEVLKNKVEIGNHTHTHNYFLNEPSATRYSTFEDEIELSQSIILKNLAITPVVFSYPYGEFDTGMKKIVKKMGFKAGAAQNSGVMHSRGDLFQCPRFPMSEAYSSRDKFIEKARMEALHIQSEGPDNFNMTQDKQQPLLTLIIEAGDLQLDQLQCFVQGGKCTLRTVDRNDKTIKVTLQSTKKITSRRRTLYTLTAPDRQGVWHWHSHLWVNSGIVE